MLWKYNFYSRKKLNFVNWTNRLGAVQSLTNFLKLYWECCFQAAFKWPSFEIILFYIFHYTHCTKPKFSKMYLKFEFYPQYHDKWEHVDKFEQSLGWNYFLCYSISCTVIPVLFWIRNKYWCKGTYCVSKQSWKLLSRV